ncbi:MAG: hypothetical protein KC433_07060 [Anaerolineales bacterium]|nr:hypothetical protein [Anaerolineales bacterium]
MTIEFQPLKGNNGRSDSNREIGEALDVAFQPLKGNNGRSDGYQHLGK